MKFPVRRNSSGRWCTQVQVRRQPLIPHWGRTVGVIKSMEANISGHQPASDFLVSFLGSFKSVWHASLLWKPNISSSLYKPLMEGTFTLWVLLGFPSTATIMDMIEIGELAQDAGDHGRRQRRRWRLNNGYTYFGTSYIRLSAYIYLSCLMSCRYR